MVSLDDAVVVRLKRGGATFEILVDSNGALAFKRGEEIVVETILAVEDVFKDARDGDHPAEDDVRKAFQTTDKLKVATEILEHGDLHLTTEQKKALLEEKKRQVISTIAANAINPQTMTPHPPTRIEAAMEEAGVHIDPLKSVDDLVSKTMVAIRPIIPIRFEEISVAVKVPAEYASKAYGEITRFGTVEKDKWQNDGSWTVVMKIPAGLQDDFYGVVNKMTKGNAETKIIKK
ncbi:MAG: ribosome assembly factor SBDS [Methanosarcinales archaeon]|nr:ribosome assembly factor SBDS [Methanosarcinales archaeon]